MTAIASGVNTTLKDFSDRDMEIALIDLRKSYKGNLFLIMKQESQYDFTSDALILLEVGQFEGSFYKGENYHLYLIEAAANVIFVGKFIVRRKN